MSCSEILARYSEYLDGEMAAVDLDRWQNHLATCAMCARYDRVLRQGLTLVHRDLVTPDPEFTLHLRYRLAYEEQRAAMGPVTASAATSVTVAAVLALAAWLPIMVLSRAEPTRPAATVTSELDRTASEMAWRGGVAFEEHSPASERLGVSAWLQTAHPALATLDRGYTPLVIDPPTAPPTYTQTHVRLTSLSSR